MPRTLLIGLDSADADLVERWSDEGSMPVVAALRSQGLWSRLRTTAEVLHVSAWPTIYTGATPGHHGMYHAYQVHAGEKGIHRTRPEECALPPFWKFLDAAGRKCLVMDAFMDYPLEGFRGLQVLEYGTWTWFGEPGARPKQLWKEITREFGPYPAPEHTKVLTVPEPAHFRDQLLAGALKKGEVVRWLLREKPWDMAFVTFGEPHGGGHYLWHVGDTEYPAHPSGDLSGAPDPLRRVYEAVDEAIGMILEVVDDDTTVLVTSGDGMGPNYSAAHHMPELLRRLGLSHAGDDAVEDGPRGPRRSSGGGVMSTIRNAIPLSLRHAVTRCLPHSLHYRLNLKWINAGIDWQHSRMFCIPNSNEGYFRVNLAGREPTGTVTSETEYDELLAELCDHISKLVHPSTGQRAAHSILSMDRTYQGSERRHLPDLVATWDPEARILDELQTDAYGVIRQRPGYETVPYYTGNHRPASFVLGRGPRVAQGRTIADASIVDIAPTVLASLAVDPPAHFEGDAWKEILGG